jgi:hypothetical protein
MFDHIHAPRQRIVRVQDARCRAEWLVRAPGRVLAEGERGTTYRL